MLDGAKHIAQPPAVMSGVGGTDGAEFSAFKEATKVLDDAKESTQLAEIEEKPECAPTLLSCVSLTLLAGSLL